MQALQVGKVQVTRAEEMIWTISPRFLFPQLSYGDLVPHFCEQDLKLRLSIHSFVLRTPITRCWWTPASATAVSATCPSGIT